MYNNRIEYNYNVQKHDKLSIKLQGCLSPTS